MELPQEACAAGRLQRFGISSEPSLTTGAAPFVTGLTSNGRLTSAASTPAFYGAPLIAWTPAFGADVYEVQYMYSKTSYPFKPAIDPRSKTTGILTRSTSDVLPFLKGAMAGIWWYRVRGIDYNLPTGVQQMGLVRSGEARRDGAEVLRRPADEEEIQGRRQVEGAV